MPVTVSDTCHVRTDETMIHDGKNFNFQPGLKETQHRDTVNCGTQNILHSCVGRRVLCRNDFSQPGETAQNLKNGGDEPFHTPETGNSTWDRSRRQT